ncbi:MAG TPA: class I SAM-dependent methyltransferase [Lacipirellulaceae bacterium]|jgi:predicted O-methyltransferase YrrM|nr:class I SAM-dependent methyltransferase [Lacipirellulaceae bacterium]
MASKRIADVEFEPPKIAIPAAMAALIADAQQRIDDLDNTTRIEIPAFVPSNFEASYRALAEIQKSNLATGRRFIEWGSGMGVVACLASSLGFDAVGIEIEPKLVTIARKIADAHHIDVQFACGSFVPDGVNPRVDWIDGVAWLTTTGVDGHEELELDPDDFDVVFAYPWPGEEQVIFDLFVNTAAVGSLLLTYHGIDGLKLQRKIKR